MKNTFQRDQDLAASAHDQGPYQDLILQVQKEEDHTFRQRPPMSRHYPRTQAESTTDSTKQ